MLLRSLTPLSMLASLAPALAHPSRPHRQSSPFTALLRRQHISVNQACTAFYAVVDSCVAYRPEEHHATFSVDSPKANACHCTQPFFFHGKECAASLTSEEHVEFIAQLNHLEQTCLSSDFDNVFIIPRQAPSIEPPVTTRTISLDTDESTTTTAIQTGPGGFTIQTSPPEPASAGGAQPSGSGSGTAVVRTSSAAASSASGSSGSASGSSRPTSSAASSGTSTSGSARSSTSASVGAISTGGATGGAVVGRAVGWGGVVVGGFVGAVLLNI